MIRYFDEKEDHLFDEDESDCLPPVGATVFYQKSLFAEILKLKVKEIHVSARRLGHHPLTKVSVHYEVKCEKIP